MGLDSAGSLCHDAWMDKIVEEKSRIRREALARRRAMTRAEVEEKSAVISAYLMGMPLVRDAETLLTYVDSKDNEVITRGLIWWALKEGKRVLVPVTEGKEALRWCILERLEDLVPSGYGILEPPANSRSLIDVCVGLPCLVPGVAFGLDGARLGYGMGFFDRFLSESRSCAIALAFETQLYERLPVEAHDVPMDWIVTELGPMPCGKEGEARGPAPTP